MHIPFVCMVELKFLAHFPSRVSSCTPSVLVCCIFFYHYYLTPYEFFASALVVDLSLEFE